MRMGQRDQLAAAQLAAFPGSKFLKKALKYSPPGLLYQGAKKVGKVAAKGGKMTFRQFLKVSKLALKGMCALPGPVRSAAIAAALTAATGGAGFVATQVSETAADTMCKAMASGKRADLEKAQKELTASTGVKFKEDSWWDKLLEALGLR